MPDNTDDKMTVEYEIDLLNDDGEVVETLTGTGEPVVQINNLKQKTIFKGVSSISIRPTRVETHSVLIEYTEDDA